MNKRSRGKTTPNDGDAHDKIKIDQCSFLLKKERKQLKIKIN